MAKYLDSTGLTYLWSKIKATFVAKETGKGLSTNDFTTTLKNKLDGIEAGANNYTHPTATAADAAAVKVGRDNKGHVVLGNALTKSDVGLGNVTNDSQVKRSEMGVANGVATLGADGLVPAAQLPSYVDDVLEYAKLSSFPATGETGKIYVALDTNLTYRWTGSQYTEISKSLALGETSSTAYSGDKGKANAEAISALQSRMTSAESGINTNAGNISSLDTRVTAIEGTTGVTGVKGSSETTYRTGDVNITAANIGLGNLTNNKQIKGLASGATENHVVIFGTDGYTVKDSGYTLGASFTAAKDTKLSNIDTNATADSALSNADIDAAIAAA